MTHPTLENLVAGPLAFGNGATDNIKNIIWASPDKDIEIYNEADVDFDGTSHNGSFISYVRQYFKYIALEVHCQRKAIYTLNFDGDKHKITINMKDGTQYIAYTTVDTMKL